MINKKQFAIGFVVLFIVLTIYLYKNNDKIANIIANDGIQGSFWYFISNPAYVMLIISIVMLNTEAGYTRNILGTIMFIIASDLISYPRFSPASLTQEPLLLASMDGLIINKLLLLGLSYHTAYFIFYIIFPIALILGALATLGISNFFNKLIGKG